MSRFDEPIEDGQLVAYVDGELGDADARKVESAIARDPELRRKVELFRMSGSIAREAFRGSRHESGSLRFARRRSGAAGVNAKPRHALQRAALPVAASILIAVIGFAAGVWHGKRVEPTFVDNLVDEIAEYHAVYARESEHQVEVKADHLDEIESWLGERLQRKLHVPDLTDHGLIFRGARLLVVEKQPVAQLLYSARENPDQPFAICITAGQGEEVPLRMATREDISLALWGDNGFVYVLAGWLNSPTLAALAAELKPKLDEI